MAKLTGRTATGVIGKLLGVEEGTEGVVLLAGTVNGTITGSTTAGVHSALAGNDVQTVLKDTLIGGAAGGWIGGFSASLKLALSEAVGSVGFMIIKFLGLVKSGMIIYVESIEQIISKGRYILLEIY